MDQTSNAPQGAPVPESRKNTGMAIVAYILFFVPLLTDAKNDPFVRFHVKQGLMLFIYWVVAWVILIIPLLGALIYWLLVIFGFILLIIGIINAASGKENRLPVIGKFADKFNF